MATYGDSFDLEIHKTRILSHAHTTIILSTMFSADTGVLSHGERHRIQDRALLRGLFQYGNMFPRVSPKAKDQLIAKDGHIVAIYYDVLVPTVTFEGKRIKLLRSVPHFIVGGYEQRRTLRAFRGNTLYSMQYWQNDPSFVVNYQMRCSDYMVDSYYFPAFHRACNPGNYEQDFWRYVVWRASNLANVGLFWMCDLEIYGYSCLDTSPAIDYAGTRMAGEADFMRHIEDFCRQRRFRLGLHVAITVTVRRYLLEGDFGEFLKVMHDNHLVESLVTCRKFRTFQTVFYYGCGNYRHVVYSFELKQRLACWRVVLADIALILAPWIKSCEEAIHVLPLRHRVFYGLPSIHDMHGYLAVASGNEFRIKMLQIVAKNEGSNVGRFDLLSTYVRPNVHLAK